MSDFAWRYVRNPQALFSPVGDDIVALDVEHGRCFGMEDVTAEVWRQLERPRTLDELCASLVSLYEVDVGKCREEVGSLIDQMVSEGIVRLA